jgi:hypothetical protein
MRFAKATGRALAKGHYRKMRLGRIGRSGSVNNVSVALYVNTLDQSRPGTPLLRRRSAANVTLGNLQR